MNKTLVAAAVTLAAASLSSQAMARDSIYIVGSSTVFPFSTAVAETFGRNTDFATPKVESTGSGGGLKLFCAGVGVDHPDITNASRRMKASEFELCQEAGVEDITEVKIGYDGIAIANSREGERLDLSLRDIWLALAKDVPNEAGELVPNPYQTWNEVNPDLPEITIEVLGPPPTSGTRDAFVELAMEGGCKTYDFIKAMKQEDKSRYKAVCHGIREDGAYVEAGENDNLIVQKLVANPDALGIFGFSFLDQNADQVQGSKVDGVEPTFESIADGDYPVSRSLFFYVKNAHVGTIPGIAEFVAEFTGEQAWGPEGYLVDKGLIPLPEAMRAEVASAAQSFAPMSRP
ncbi:PstS family phosphate ABC transporter substrate-binding protein [Marichromatium bheemlicum]|uniref:PstS family phosphate ABC transporter substrate-binding protein n=1 Tax=Marichromatium bheemlicum TaxID=365339 RepID=A0ABX1I4N9_9GAMM|nr:PstS family phosphate ABC transporter substrate-binding protein [Marichromatium bheemlicum]NKN32108.1 PstS family phosphate ABC transporter substrate-binding protein [Marichromatium bheemlicum]